MSNRSTGKMISKWLLYTALIAGTIPAFAQQQSTKGDDEGILSQQAAERDKAAIDNALNGWWTTSIKTHDARIAWWQQARLGCFIHWGVYSVPGGAWKGKEVGGYAEHLMRKATIPVAAYKQELLASFNPTDFNADTWVRTIKEAGMRYLIITAKHHDGIAMYPSDVSDMDISSSAFKRDPMKELAAACKRYGIKFGFYYSHAFDWEHPDAPGNDWDYDNPGGDKGLYGGGNWYDTHPERLPKAVKYVNEKAIPQIRELIHKYHPDILWFDTPHKLPLSENIRILQAIREIDNKVVVNGRLARSANISFGDYKNTADRPAEFYPVTGDWEAIPTTNESYGYSRYDSSHKPVSFFIRLIAKAAARGGNLLMNIGPMGNGVIDPRDTTILHGIGVWMKTNGESIYSTSATPLPIQPWGESTRKGNQLFLQVFDWPQQSPLYVGGLKSEVKKAWLLADKNKRPLQVNRVNDKDITIVLPRQAPDSCNSVVVLDMQNISTDTVRVLDTKTLTNVLRAFDADLHGKGLQYGDGKSNKYYVYGWNKPEQQLSWTVRVNAPARFRVGIKYAADAQTGQNNYRIKAGKSQLTGLTANLTVKGERILTSPLGEIQLPAGVHQIIIQPDQIRGTELMKLFELTLTPVE